MMTHEFIGGGHLKWHGMETSIATPARWPGKNRASKSIHIFHIPIANLSGHNNIYQTVVICFVGFFPDNCFPGKLFSNLPTKNGRDRLCMCECVYLPAWHSKMPCYLCIIYIFGSSAPQCPGKSVTATTRFALLEMT